MAVALLLVLVWVASASTGSSALLNEKVVTHIDASTQLVHVNSKITVKNKQSEPVDSYLFLVDPQWMHNVSYIEARDSEENVLLVNRDYAQDSWIKYKIIFHQPLKPGMYETIQVQSVIFDYLMSFPKSVKQGEKHFVMFSFNVYYCSIYHTHWQIIYLHLGSTKVTQIEGPPYKLITDDERFNLQYGPYLDMAPMAKYNSVLHYENLVPFLTVEKLERFIKISHWGYISVWDHVTLVNNGPAFKGPYERPAPREAAPPDTRVDFFISSLPPDAIDVDMKDDIGSIYSFEVDYYSEDKTDVTIKPRFVLYGGWKTKYLIQYSIPISGYVFWSNADEYVMTIPLVDVICDKMVIREAKISYVLPEGGTFIDIDPYFQLENNTDNRFCYFIDVFCREVVSFKMNSLSEAHSRMSVSVTYSFSKLFMLMKPLLIALSLYVIYLVLIVYRYTFPPSDTTPPNSSRPGTNSRPNIQVPPAREVKPPITLPSPAPKLMKKFKRKSKKC